VTFDACNVRRVSTRSTRGAVSTRVCERRPSARRARHARKHDTQAHAPKHEHAFPPTRTCKNSRKTLAKALATTLANSRKNSPCSASAANASNRRHPTAQQARRAVLGVTESAPPSTPPSAAGRFHGETAHFHGEPRRKNSRKNTPCISKCVSCKRVETAPSHRATGTPSTGARRWE
jgi:hypothetical protein